MTTHDHLIDYLNAKSRHYRAFRDQYRVDDLVTNWRNYTAREDRFNRYAEMTSHGPSHLEGVAGLVAEFTLPFRKGGCLNDSEMFVLKAMAHLHDIGMYTTYDPHFVDPFRIRKMHGYLSREAILRERALLFPQVADTAAIELIALLCSYHQGSAALSDAELAAQPERKKIRVPADHRIHGTEEIEDVVIEPETNTRERCFVQWSLERELKYASAKGENLFRLSNVGEDICPFQLGALIKLLDGCDFHSARIGSIESVFRHADRNRSHLQRTKLIQEECLPNSQSYKRAKDELKFFAAGIFHLIRNLMIERTMILTSEGSLQIVIKPAPFADVQGRADALIESMGAMAWGESETQNRLREVCEIVSRYIADPIATLCSVLNVEPGDGQLAEWDIRNVPPDPCDNVHYLGARKYIHREYNDVRHAMAGPKGKDWPYCRVCANSDNCSLKERAWPVMESADGLCSVAAYESGKHGPLLAGSPHFAYRSDLSLPKGQFQRAGEQNRILKELTERKQLLIAGPEGRGRSTLLAAIAKDLSSSETPTVFSFLFSDGEDQIPSFIRSFASFLAARGDFLLSNVIVDEQPSSKHETALLSILRAGRPEHRGQRLLLCLDDFNRVVKGVEFFRAVIESFPCISCEQASACQRAIGERYGCKEASSLVLISSTKRPGDRWFKSGEFPVFTHEASALTDKEVQRAATLYCRDREFAVSAAAIWRAYGSEAFVIPILQKYSAGVWDHALALRLIEDDIATFLVRAFYQRLGSEKSLNMMRLASMLDGCVSELELRQACGLPVRGGEDELTMLFDRGLIQVSEGCVVVRSTAWSEGHRRSRWLDRLEGSVVPTLEAYIRSSQKAAGHAADHWAELQPYFPGRSVDDVKTPPKSRARE